MAADYYTLSAAPSCATSTNGGGGLDCAGTYAPGNPAIPDEGADTVFLLDSTRTVVDTQPMPRRAPTAQFAGVADGTYSLEWRTNDNLNSGQLLALASATVQCADGSGGGGTPTDPPVIGCMAPNAFNYDQAATQDETPTLCVFVVVDIAPRALVAAHLPIPVVMRAAPTLAGLASIVVLYLETAATPAGSWQEFGRLRQVCDATATVRFDLSEAAKSLLRLGPPVEAGTDVGLSALLRARYEVLDPVTLAALYTGEAGRCRVLNAVVQSSTGATLTTPTPYAELPDGAALWRTMATYAGGVSTTALALPASGCPARQFAWLNAAGAWDTGFFAGRHIHGTDQADPIPFRDTAGAGRYAKRGTVRPTLQVYSDKVDWLTFQLLRGVRDSVQVWERVGPGQYVPVLVSTESYQEYQEQTDKTYQVNFTVSYPAQLIQTQ